VSTVVEILNAFSSLNLLNLQACVTSGR